MAHEYETKQNIVREWGKTYDELFTQIILGTSPKPDHTMALYFHVYFILSCVFHCFLSFSPTFFVQVMIS